MCRPYGERSRWPRHIEPSPGEARVLFERVARGAGRAGAVGGLMLLALAACSSSPPATEQTERPVSAVAEAAAGKEAQAAKGEQTTVPAAAVVEEPLPPQAVQQFDQAVVHLSAGDNVAAERELRALATAYPTYSGSLLNLGILLAKVGRLGEAEKELRGAIERNARNAAAFNQLGIVYRRLGRFKEADAAYRRAVEIDPNYAIAYLNLGVLCDLYLQEPQRALEAYERYLALAAAPDEKVNGWVSELRKRLGSGPPHAARTQ